MNDPNVESVRRMLTERSRRGFNKYGVTTVREDLDMLDWLIHLQEEMLDASIYIEVLKNKIRDDWK